MMDTATKNTAIKANLKALYRILDSAQTRADEAAAAAELGEINQAIGAALGLDALLDDARALFTATLVLHRGG